MGTILGLSDEESLALATIISGRRAWVTGLAGSAVDRLVEVGLVVLWASDVRGHPLGGGPYVTLTPWGAEYLGLELRERYWVKWVHYPTHHERVLVEEPYWARVSSHSRRPLVLPHQAQQCGLEYPELVPDHSAGPEYLMDGDGNPVTLLGGHKVRVDHRLTRR